MWQMRVQDILHLPPTVQMSGAPDPESSSRRISVESLSDDAGNFCRDSKRPAAIIIVMRNVNRWRRFRAAGRVSEVFASLPSLTLEV
jgi:hypothetical protein